MAATHGKRRGVEVFDNRLAGFAFANQQTRVVGIESRPVRVVRSQSRRWTVRLISSPHDLSAENRIDEFASRLRQRRERRLTIDSAISLDARSALRLCRLYRCSLRSLSKS